MPVNWPLIRIQAKTKRACALGTHKQYLRRHCCYGNQCNCPKLSGSFGLDRMQVLGIHGSAGKISADYLVSTDDRKWQLEP